MTKPTTENNPSPIVYSDQTNSKLRYYAILSGLFGSVPLALTAFSAYSLSQIVPIAKEVNSEYFFPFTLQVVLLLHLLESNLRAMRSEYPRAAGKQVIKGLLIELVVAGSITVAIDAILF